MKLLTKLTLVVAVVAAVGTTAAFADDQRLQDRLAITQAQDSPHTTTTVAVYANHHGVVIRTDANTGDNQRFELRSNGHGQLIGEWVQVR